MILYEILQNLTNDMLYIRKTLLTFGMKARVLV